MRTKTLCTSCEQYVYTDADHSCHNAKALRAVRDAEAGVIAAAERETAAEDRCEEMAGYDASEADACAASKELLDAVEARGNAVRALHAARQGVGA
jgi:hypothetical protein